MRHILASCILLSQVLRTQESVPKTTLTGHVLDDSTGAPLLLANVFIAGSTIGTSTAEDGSFVLKEVPFGTVEVVASLIGYKRVSSSLHVSSLDNPSVELRLTPSLIQLKPVLIDASERIKNLKKFMELFFGFSRNAKDCRVANTEIIEFQPGDEPGMIRVDIGGPIDIENKNLGYRLDYFLDEFTMHEKYVQFVGVTHFEDLKPKGKDQEREWMEARKKAYKGSLQHFLSALVRRQLKEEGFSTYFVDEISLTNRLRKKLEPDSVSSQGKLPFEKKLSFKGFLEINYFGERPEPGFKDFLVLQGATSPRYTRLLAYQTSWITMNRPEVTVNVDGLLYDPLAIMTYGYWSFERVGEMLPLDYRPPPD